MTFLMKTKKPKLYTYIVRCRVDCECLVKVQATNAKDAVNMYECKFPSFDTIYEFAANDRYVRETDNEEEVKANGGKYTNFKAEAKKIKDFKL